MANIHILQAARFLFCLFITCSAFCHASDPEIFTFNFPSQTNIELSADASVLEDVIRLTIGQESLGWATFPYIIPPQSLAKFSTHFQFSMVGNNGNGDGLTFFLAPFDFESYDAEPGKWLGLFESETDGNSSNQIVAVEFDTYKNDFDPNDNHVGIDVNSIVSLKNVSVSDGALNNGKKWDAWVDYNGAQIQVFLLYNPNDATPSKPESPLMVYDIDLSQFLPSFVKVGFSASTGSANESHVLHVWDFSCQFRPEVSIVIPPLPSFTSPSVTTPPAEKENDDSLSGSFIGIVIGIVVFFLVIVWIIGLCRGRRNKTTPLQVATPPLQVETFAKYVETHVKVASPVRERM